MFYQELSAYLYSDSFHLSAQSEPKESLAHVQSVCFTLANTSEDSKEAKSNYIADKYYCRRVNYNTQDKFKKNKYLFSRIL